MKLHILVSVHKSIAMQIKDVILLDHRTCMKRPSVQNLQPGKSWASAVIVQNRRSRAPWKHRGTRTILHLHKLQLESMLLQHYRKVTCEDTRILDSAVIYFVQS